MFDNLTTKLTTSFKVLSGNAKLNEKNIKLALKEIRKSLLEADVALEVVTDFLQQTEQEALGLKVGSGLNPKQEFIKLVQRKLTYVIGSDTAEINLKTTTPAVIMVAGLQGSGKTTSAVKLAKHLKQRYKKKVLLVSTDIYRPAAIQQLAILAAQIDVECFASSTHEKVKDILDKAHKFAKINFFDIMIIDTAGRTTIDHQMMEELSTIHRLVSPIETLFVVDSMTGQDAAHTAKIFADSVELTGVVLTKIDGDARGGAALSVKHITGKPIKFLGTGEQLDSWEIFHPDRLVSRILGMGDVLSLIEEIETKVDKKQALKTANKIQKGKFDFNDMKSQLEQMQQMGGIEAIMTKLPGAGDLSSLKLKNKMLGDVSTNKMIAIINSMTYKERIYTNLVNKGSRKRRIAQGSGTKIQDINKLTKQLEKMQKMMKKMSYSRMKKIMAQLSGNNGYNENMPDLTQIQQQLKPGDMPFKL